MKEENRKTTDIPDVRSQYITPSLLALEDPTASSLADQHLRPDLLHFLNHTQGPSINKKESQQGAESEKRAERTVVGVSSSAGDNPILSLS